MSDAVVLRTAIAADIPAVLELWRSARSAAAVTPDDAEDLRRLLVRSPDGLLVATAGGTVVGALVAVSDGWRGNLYRLAVLPAHRRRGIGRDLVALGQARLAAQGIVRVTALVGEDEEDATAFWRACGYEHSAEIARFVRNL